MGLRVGTVPIQVYVPFPIRDSREVLGVIEFFSDEVRAPDEDLLQMVATLVHNQVTFSGMAHCNQIRC